MLPPCPETQAPRVWISNYRNGAPSGFQRKRHAPIYPDRTEFRAYNANAFSSNLISTLTGNFRISPENSFKSPPDVLRKLIHIFIFLRIETPGDQGDVGRPAVCCRAHQLCSAPNESFTAQSLGRRPTPAAISAGKASNSLAANASPRP